MKNTIASWTFAQWFSAGMCVLCMLFFWREFEYIVHHPDCLKDSVTAAFLTAISSGVLAAFAKCYTYVVGSSASSQAKDDVIANSTPNPVQPKNP